MTTATATQPATLNFKAAVELWDRCKRNARILARDQQWDESGAMDEKAEMLEELILEAIGSTRGCFVVVGATTYRIDPRNRHRLEVEHGTDDDGLTIVNPFA